MYARGLTYDVIRHAAQTSGMDDAGIVAAQRWDDDALFMDEWVAQGLHGNMSYFERNQAKRYDIRELVPGARTVVVTLLTYEHSGHDYHRTVKSLLYQMKQTLAEMCDCGQEMFSSTHQHIFCDSAPVLERRMAVAAGLGFIGRNHQLIHPCLGSRVHIGELVLQVDVEDDRIVKPTYSGATSCGECRRCIDACPGKALGRQEWDARRCIAYITHKCEICQQVCPYNEKLI